MVPDSAFSASSNTGYNRTYSRISFYYSLGAASSRLYRTYNGSWAPEHPSAGEYITADLGKAYDVVAVANQGISRYPSSYITKFKFLHSMDGVNFEYVVDDNNEHYVFSLLHAIQDTVEYNMLPYTVHATHVRLEVVQFNSFAAVRWDVFFLDTSKIYIHVAIREYTCSINHNTDSNNYCYYFYDYHITTFRLHADAPQWIGAQESVADLTTPIYCRKNLAQTAGKTTLA